MTPEKFQSLPIIALKDTVRNDPTGYTDLQLALLPYTDFYHSSLWVVFLGIILILSLRYLLIPAGRGLFSQHAAEKTTQNSDLTEHPRNWYERLFNLHEIRGDIALQLFGGAVLLGFLLTFRGWEGSMAGSTNSSTYLCWPFFQSCGDWIFMDTRPYGYTKNTVFMVLFGLIMLSTYGLLAKRYILTHVSILILFIAKLYFMATNFAYNANYDYYHTLFAFVFLFLPHKRFFGSLAVVVFYFLSTASKVHETWSLGTYFTALQPGLPLFPESLTPVMTNFVLIMEMVFAWALFSRIKLLQRSVFAFFVIFHLYSGILVGYHYPSIVTPALIIFFGPLYKPFERIPLDLKSIIGWALMYALLFSQMISHMIPGDEKLTMEGNFYGLYMFEANHQCSVRIYDKNGETVSSRDSATARNRCDPYQYMFRAQQSFCTSSRGQFGPYHMKMTHSINGGPFYFIVDEPDLCTLKYKPFSRNEWIKDETQAKPTARPRKNFYW
jgi:hypothetical protein